MIEIIPNWHPILVHFTIGLLSTAVVFYLLSMLLPVGEKLKSHWQIVARWCLWSGMAITVLTLIAGYLAYNSVAHDTPSHEAMTEHRNWAFATAAVFAVLTLWSVWIHLKKQIPSIAFLVLALVSGALLASTGWHGGEAVYRYGLGVMSLPQTSGEGHSHEHAAGAEHGNNLSADAPPSGKPSKSSHSDNEAHSHEPATGAKHGSDMSTDTPHSDKDKGEPAASQPSGDKSEHHDAQPHAH